MIETPRLRLRPWRDADRTAFAAMLADPAVMQDLGGTVDRAAADAKLDRYVATLAQAGTARLAVTGHDDGFLGYAGVMPLEPGHPAGAAFDVGWRLVRAAWGWGFATEAAAAALHDAFDRLGLPEVVAFTAPDNLRSQAVMQRLGMHRDPGRDFTAAWGGGDWHGLVWTARPTPATGA
ncbi:MAG: GNAT family N-acetyltransferase [Marinovum algicola]|uniref:GNAT family N-acetyltransferase n=1 Tax=Alphaproteobacteria TaxID=28211 RepID=UPI0032ED56A8